MFTGSTLDLTTRLKPLIEARLGVTDSIKSGRRQPHWESSSFFLPHIPNARLQLVVFDRSQFQLSCHCLIRSITVMVSRSTPSLLSQSTTSTAVAPCDDADKDYEATFANMMAKYGMSSYCTPTLPSAEQLQRQKRHGIFASFRGSSQRAAPKMVKEEEEDGEEAAADEGDAKKPVRKERRWSLKPVFGRSQ
jgi:hypothetical protein